MLNPSLRLPLSAPACVLSTGAFLKNRACFMGQGEVFWSLPHGNLDHADARLALEASVDALRRPSEAEIQAVAHDLHPDFFSSRLAATLADSIKVPAIAVQHHHAHIAATIAEHGIRSAVIGIALDGVGYGCDGKSWGGELLWVDGGWSAHQWCRLAHLYPIAMAGGDKAAREPWRLAAALLHELGRSAEIAPRLSGRVERQAIDVVSGMLQQDVNCPRTSSAGRWFDAAAAALDLSSHQSQEAQAAQRLEQRASAFLTRYPAFDWPWQSLDLRPVVADLFDMDKHDRESVSRGAAIFHLALINGLAHAATLAAQRHGVQDVALGGGCLANRVLRERLISALRNANLRVHVPSSIPCGDAGLALGQAWVAACALHANASRASATGKHGRRANRHSTGERQPVAEEAS